MITKIRNNEVGMVGGALTINGKRYLRDYLTFEEYHLMIAYINISKKLYNDGD